MHDCIISYDMPILYIYIYTNCDILNISKLSNYIELLIVSLYYFTLSQLMFFILL